MVLVATMPAPSPPTTTKTNKNHGLKQLLDNEQPHHGGPHDDDGNPIYTDNDMDNEMDNNDMDNEMDSS